MPRHNPKRSKSRKSFQKLLRKSRSRRYSSLTAREKATRERTLALLSDLRGGKGSYTELLRKHHLDTRTAHKYLGRDLLGGTGGTRVRPSKADMRVRELLFPMSSGDLPFRTRSSQDATKLSEFFHDRDKLLRGKLSAGRLRGQVARRACRGPGGFCGCGRNLCEGGCRRFAGGEFVCQHGRCAMIGRTAKTVLRDSRKEVCPPRKVCPFCFEDDHIGGGNHIPHLTVHECQLHHAWLTEERLAAGAEMKKQSHSVKSIEMALRSLAVTAHAIAWAIDKLSEGLEFCAETLKRVRR